MAAGATYREQWFWQARLAADHRGLRPAAERGRARRNASWISEFAASRAASRRQPEPARVLDGADDQGRLRRLGGVHGVQPAALAVGVRRAAARGRRRGRATPTTRRAAASTRGRPASTCRSRSSCGSAPPCRATCASRRSTSGSTCKAAAATSRRTRSTTSRPATTRARRRCSRSRRRRSAIRSCRPEEADTITAGFVVEPQRTGLQFSVDWYDIDLSDAIGQLGVQRIVNECNAGSGQPVLRLRVPRSRHERGHGRPQPVAEHQQRARPRPRLRAALEHATRTCSANRAEALTLRFLAGRLLEDSTTTPGGQPVDLSGQLSEPEIARAWRRCGISSASGASACSSATSARVEINGGTIHVRPVRAGPRAGCRAVTIDDATVDCEGLHRYHGQLRPRARQRPRVAVGAGDHERARRGSAGDPDVRSAVQLADEPRQRVRRVRPALPSDVPLPALAARVFGRPRPPAAPAAGGPLGLQPRDRPIW